MQYNTVFSMLPGELSVGHASIVEKQMHATKCTKCNISQILNIFSFGDVTLDEAYAVWTHLQFLALLHQSVIVQVSQHHLHILLQGSFSEGMAKAACCPMRNMAK